MNCFAKNVVTAFMVAGFVCICVGLRAQAPFMDGAIKKDTRGDTLNAHGGGIIFHKGTYYWFGEIKRGHTWLVPGQSWEDYRVPAGGVACYSSKDLRTWKNEGVALRPVKGQPDHDLDTSKVIERPKVIYNRSTKKFVMWMHIDANDYSHSQAGVAVSDKIAGPYTYLGSVKPNGQMLRDMTLFKDDDEKAFVVYSSDFNKTLHICLLSDDYLSATSSYKEILPNQSREAPALFKSGGKYFLITSGCSGWSPNQAAYASADQPFGPWTEQGNPCMGPGADSTFGSQSTFVFPLPEGGGRFVFMADRWNKSDLPDSRYLWLPLTVTGNKVVISPLTASAANK